MDGFDHDHVHVFMSHEGRTAHVAFDPRQPVPPEHELTELFRSAWGASVPDDWVPWPWKAEDMELWVPCSAENPSRGYTLCDIKRTLTYQMLMQAAVISAYCKSPSSLSYGYAILRSKHRSSYDFDAMNEIRARVVDSSGRCPFCANA